MIRGRNEKITTIYAVAILFRTKYARVAVYKYLRYAIINHRTLTARVNVPGSAPVDPDSKPGSNPDRGAGVKRGMETIGDFPRPPETTEITGD